MSKPRVIRCPAFKNWPRVTITFCRRYCGQWDKEREVCLALEEGGEKSR